MHLLFVGGFYSSPLLDFFQRNTKTGLDFCSQNLEESIFLGFEENKFSFSRISIPHIGSFPFFFKTPFVPSYKSKDGSEYSISYLNILYFKRFSYSRNLYNAIYKWCDRHSAESVILFYTYHSCVELSSKIKRRYPNIKICFMVTDLKDFRISSNLIMRLNSLIDSIKKRDDTFHNSIDGYIVLSANMVKRLPVGEKPWLLLEGIYNTKVYIDNPSKFQNRVILYTGKIEKSFGVIDLLHAFMKIEDPNYLLLLCGYGDACYDVQELAMQDARIKYLGILPRKEILKLQKQATVLVNPRHSFEEYTAYSFPSKTMEYLASGTPTLMCRLRCLPHEYLQYLYFFDDESIDGIKDKIIEICEKTEQELIDFGRKASEFIYREKLPLTQSKKMLSFLQELIN